MEDSDTAEVTARDRRQLKPSDGLQRHGARNACQEAKRYRLQHENCFMNEGQVTWRHDFVLLVTCKNQQLAIPLRHVFNKFTNDPLHKLCAVCK
jgi:hypothetical protein